MKMRWTVLTLTTLIAGPVAAGVVYEIDVTDHEQSPPKTEYIQAAVDGRNLKMGNNPGEDNTSSKSGGRSSQGEMIFRGERREIVMVDHAKNSYSVMDGETIKQIG